MSVRVPIFLPFRELKKLMAGTGWLVLLILVCMSFCSCRSTSDATRQLQAALNTPPSNHHAYDAERVSLALQQFGRKQEAAFAVLREAANKTNLLVEGGRTIDVNKSTRMAALYGMGLLGKSVPAAKPFLWEVIYSPARSGVDRYAAFAALKQIGFHVGDIPVLAKLLASPACNQNILTKMVPLAISSLIESDPPAAKPLLASVEVLLDSTNADTRFRAALALVKTEGAIQAKIFTPLHDLFQRPNSHAVDYYKMLAAAVLAEAGVVAKPLVPDLLEFAKLPDENYVYQLIAEIAPEIGSEYPEVAQALKDQQRRQAWSGKWKSGSYTLEDLRAALKEPDQVLSAAKRFAQMGKTARPAVPKMIRAMWGMDEDARNEILADIQKIDPQPLVIKIDLNKERVGAGLDFAKSVLEKMPDSPPIKNLKDACFQLYFTAGWVLPDELAALTNNLAKQAPNAYRAYLKGLEPPTCSKPTGSNVWTLPTITTSTNLIKP